MALGGDPGPIRTGDLPLRRGTLYPAELRGQGREDTGGGHETETLTRSDDQESIAT